jgi:hypothetical protein
METGRPGGERQTSHDAETSRAGTKRRTEPAPIKAGVAVTEPHNEAERLDRVFPSQRFHGRKGISWLGRRVAVELRPDGDRCADSVALRVVRDARLERELALARRE